MGHSHVLWQSLFPLLSLAMSHEICLGNMHSSDLSQGSLYLLEKSKNDSRITIRAHERRKERESIISIRKTAAITPVSVRGEAHF